MVFRETEFSQEVMAAGSEGETMSLSARVETLCDVNFIVNRMNPGKVQRMLRAIEIARKMSDFDLLSSEEEKICVSGSDSVPAV